MSYDTLPMEVLQFIFSFNSWSDHKTIGLVCRRWAAAVEPLLLARTCLKVSYLEVPVMQESIRYVADYIECHALSLPTKVIDRSVLVGSERSYTCLRIEWGDERREPNMGALRKVLDLCQERFSTVQKLYFKAAPGEALTDFFMTRRNWLESLTELHFEQYSTLTNPEAEQPAILRSVVELSLPKLKQLTWLESLGIELCSNPQQNQESFMSHGRYPRATQVMIKFYNDMNKMYASLDVPQLDRLKVRVKSKRMINMIELQNIRSSDRNRHLELPTDRHNLILSSLNLKFCSKLQHIELMDLYDIGIIASPSVMQIGEGICPNLKSLSFVRGTASIMEKILEKCSQLEELFIGETSGSFSVQLASNPLKKLTLKSCSHWFSHEEAIFSELRYLRLIGMNSAFSLSQVVSLNAPRLTTIVAPRIDYNLLTLGHREQIRTMVVELNAFEGNDSPVPSNVTELFLCMRQGFGRERETVEEYLRYYPNLRRLTIFGKGAPMAAVHGGVQLGLQTLQYLEHLCADGVTLRLADFRGLERLKSLVLSDCLIVAVLDDREVTVTTLDDIRVKYVTMLGYKYNTWNRFPIYGSGRAQPPPVIVETSSGSYSSANFQPKRWEEIIPTE